MLPDPARTPPTCMTGVPVMSRVNRAAPRLWSHPSVHVSLAVPIRPHLLVSPRRPCKFLSRCSRSPNLHSRSAPLSSCRLDVRDIRRPRPLLLRRRPDVRRMRRGSLPLTSAVLCLATLVSSAAMAPPSRRASPALCCPIICSPCHPVTRSPQADDGEDRSRSSLPPSWAGSCVPCRKLPSCTLVHTSHTSLPPRRLEGPIICICQGRCKVRGR